MNDDTRKLLKVFGVAVTDSEAEANKLAGIAIEEAGHRTIDAIPTAAVVRGAVCK